MIDRLAALADIVPPAPAVPPPPPPWWLGPWGMALAVAVSLALLGLLWAVWRTHRQRRALRALRRLRKTYSNMHLGHDQVSFAASAALVCARQGGVDAKELPTSCRAQLDALRYQRPGPDDGAWQSVLLTLTLALRRQAWRRMVTWRQAVSCAADAAPDACAKGGAAAAKHGARIPDGLER